MAKYRITGPDGGTYEVSAPDGASESDVLAYAQKNYKAPMEPLKADPTDGMSTFDKVAAGAGAGMTSAMRAVGLDGLAQRWGAPATKDEAAKLEAPLDATTAGTVGRGIGLAGSALPAVLAPGANTYIGATALGALTGGALTEGGLADRAQGAAFGAVGGAGGKAAGDLLGKGASALLQSRAADRAGSQVANAQKDAALQMAQSRGVVVPPADARGGFWNEALNGMSGKIKTAQVASAENQGTWNALARKELGLAPTDPLNAQTLNAVRNQASQAYNAVEGLGTITPSKNYTDALDKIVAPYTRAAQSFPNGKVNPIVSEIEALKTPAFDAADAVAKIRTLRADADAAYGSGNKEMGKSLKAGADALEQAIDEHLAAAGPSRMLTDYRNARQLIAKTYSVQKGLNDVTGDVSASTLAKQLEKGKPLSGELKAIAQIAQAFPKAAQTLKEAPKSISPLDYAVAGMSGTATGNPAMLGMMAARPAVRSLILSQPYQRAMLPNSYAPGLLDTVGLPAMQSGLLHRGLVPVGQGTGLLLGQQ